MHNHDFYIALAYGVSGLLIAVELLSLWRRWCQARNVQKEKNTHEAT